MSPQFSLSIVSHGQLALVRNLLLDLLSFAPISCEIFLTLNIVEDESYINEFKSFVRIIRNNKAKGFGSNHNSAFILSSGAFFVILNPDVRIKELDWERLLAVFGVTNVGACSPKVLSSIGSIEDSYRKFPTFKSLTLRALSYMRGSEYSISEYNLNVDWVSGIFVLFRCEAFKQVGGFDESYFMYLEDADICRRLKLAGWSTVLNPNVSVIHDAQRASRRNLRHLRWHLISAYRFIFLPVNKLPALNREDL